MRWAITRWRKCEAVGFEIDRYDNLLELVAEIDGFRVWHRKFDSRFAYKVYVEGGKWVWAVIEWQLPIFCKTEEVLYELMRLGVPEKVAKAVAGIVEAYELLRQNQNF